MSRASATDFENRRMRGRMTAGLERVRDRLEGGEFTRFDGLIGLGVAILVYLAVTVPSAMRHLWFDELFTYWIAQAPTVSQLLKDIQLDLQPPLSYLAVRGSIAVFGNTEFATRLPFLIGFLVGSLCLYRFVSQRLRPVYGLLAMLVFWSTPFLSYATEARPYALITAFFGIAMLAWQRAIQPVRSVGSVIILGLAVLGMALSHMFAVFYISPFCLAEMWRWYRSHKLDWAIWLALLLPMSVIVFFFSRVHAFESMVQPPVQLASPFKIFAFFYHTLEPEGLVLLLAVAIGLLIVFRRKPAWIAPSVLMTSVEAVFTAGLLLIPALVNLALMLVHGGFFPRYGILTPLAYGLLIAFFVAMYTNANRLAAAAACCVLLASICGTTVISSMLSTLRTWGRHTQASVHLTPLETIEPNLPLVAASGLTFLEMNKYESPEMLKRVYYLNDPDLAVRYAHATMFEGPFTRLGNYFPLRGTFEPYRKFVVEHPKFLVLGTPDYPEDWLLRRLLDIHATLRYLGNFPVLYKDTQLYEVTMPKGVA